MTSGVIHGERVLVTGAAGRIGRTVGEALTDGYAVRFHYHRTIPQKHETAAARSRETGEPVPLADGPHDIIIGDVDDLDVMERACRGVAAVVHMAADPRVQAPWSDILRANIVGTYNVYEGAHRAGARRVVFASSNHATGFYEKEGTYTAPDMPVRPDSYYGVSKCFGEALGRYYADAHGLSVVCLRIGSFQPQPRGERQLATWLSHRDTVQLVRRSLDAEISYGIFYGISGNSRAYWDITNARELLGYEPQDNAETYAASILSGAKPRS